MKLIDKIIVGLAILGWIFCVLLSLLHEPFPLSVYYFLFTGVTGWYVWRHREWLRARLALPSKHPLLKFMALGYGAVLFEEIIAAFANHVTKESFDVAVLLTRIPQFWALNILAFTGFILGWYWLSRRYRYSPRELFYLAGLWGIYAEHIYIGGPIMFAALLAPSILTYGLIITPALWSVTEGGKRELFAPFKYVLTYAVILLFSLIPIFILSNLRCAYPDTFPPASLVAADECKK
jgi:hypothetical protein